MSTVRIIIQITFDEKSTFTEEEINNVRSNNAHVVPEIKQALSEGKMGGTFIHEHYNGKITHTYSVLTD